MVDQRPRPTSKIPTSNRRASFSNRKGKRGLSGELMAEGSSFGAGGRRAAGRQRGQVFMQDSTHLLDGRWQVLAGMRPAHNEFGLHVIDMRAVVGHQAVFAFVII